MDFLPLYVIILFSMRFTPAKLRNIDTGNDHDVYLPEHVTDGWKEDEIDKSTDVKIGKKTLVVPSTLVRMVIEFGLTPKERTARTLLGHDCIVFALACETGHSQTDIPFGREANRLVNVANFDISVTDGDGFMGEPYLSAGEVAFTADALPTSPDFAVPEVARMHFMVRAAEDEHGPIYLSKFGTLGPVAAHRLDASLGYYPAQTVGQARGFSAGPINI